MRISDRLLNAQRRNRSGTILLTGATGFLGSHLAAAFLQSGRPLYLLIRPDGRQGAAERAQKWLTWFGLEEHHLPRLQIAEGYLEQEHFGLLPAQYAELLSGTNEIVHCASNTSFSERKRPEIEAANISGLRQVLKFAKESECYFFHHLSTAYVMSGKNGRCPEEPAQPGRFNNVYEETKCRGEKLVAEACATSGIRLSIYRPSIVYGNSQTGVSLNFNALYYPIRTLHFFKTLFEADLANGGQKARSMNVYHAADGSLYLPLRMETRESAGINLIPIDYLVRAFMALWEACPAGGIFHIVNAKPKPVKDLLHYAGKFLNLSGLRAVDSTAGDNNVRRNSLEILFDQYMKVYDPYIRDTRVFDDSKAQAILKPGAIECPELDYNLFAKCMQYAVAADWKPASF